MRKKKVLITGINGQDGSFLARDLIERNFNEEFNYDVQGDKFNMSQYEDNIINNLNNKISNDIVFLLGTIE